MSGSCTKQTINGWQGSVYCSHHFPPPISNMRVHWKNSARKKIRQASLQPIEQSQPTICVGYSLNAFSQFTQRQHAQKQGR
jgi:hypothetical protein